VTVYSTVQEIKKKKCKQYVLFAQSVFNFSKCNTNLLHNAFIC